MRSGHLRAIGIMLLAVGVFSAMDAGLKRLAASYSPLEVTALRATASVPFLLGSIAWSGAWGRLSVASPLLYLGRAAIGLLMLMSFIYSVSVQPLTESYAIFMSAPLMVAICARLFFGEQVPPRRWFAIVVGLCGVVVALKPGANSLISLGGLAATVSAICYALGVIAIRLMSRTDSEHALVFWYMLLICVASLALAAPHWQPIASGDWPWIALVGATGALAQYLLTIAFRLAPASKIAPFEYTALLWGLGLDYFMFGTLPVPRVFVGGAIVIAGGLLLIWDEHRNSAAHPVTSPAA
jgi:drug/metabolite transporter (DMT)-like permease